MYAGKNMGIMTTLKKTYCRKPLSPWELTVTHNYSLMGDQGA